jgi:hypothetical protein
MTRLLGEHPLKSTLLMLLALFSLAMDAGARHRKSPDNEAGTFD